MLALSLVVALMQQPLMATWTQFDATPTEAQAWTYRLYLDLQPSIILQGVTCIQGTTQTECSAPVPMSSTGTHTAQLTAANEYGESDRSDVVTFKVPGKPTRPVNLAFSKGD